MKSTKTLILLLFTLAIVLVACDHQPKPTIPAQSGPGSEPLVPGPAEPVSLQPDMVMTASQDDIQSAADANNQFAFDLYNKYKEKEGNVFYSPYSISTAIGMIYEGAKGTTAHEMRDVFHFTEDNTKRWSGMQATFLELNKENKPYKLSVANAIWAEQTYRFLPKFIDTVKNFYLSEVNNMDFINAAEESTKTINDWVEAKTNDKIKDLIPPGIVNPMTRLVLTNAIYFKGNWAEQFDKANTHDVDFFIEENNPVKVPMMSLSGETQGYAETEDVQLLELLYEGDELSMLVLLPKRDITEFEKTLTLEKMEELKSKIIRKDVDVFLPKFKFETKYMMSEDLASMGMPTAFSDQADFSGMDGGKNLFISEVIHQAFVEVNEEGTEAAAATGVVMELTSMPMDPTIFRADKPFIFLIQERETGNILFMGRVVDPRE